MKKKVFKLFLFFIPFALIIIVNIVIDSMSIFNFSKIEKLAEKQAEGYNIVGWGDYDERVFQRNAVGFKKELPKTIVLGSSRVMQIGEEIGKEEIYNHGVSSCTIMDMMGIFECYVKKGDIKFDEVIIGLDPIMFLDNEENRWGSLNEEYLSICERLNIESIELDYFKLLREKLYEIASPRYFYENVFKNSEPILSKKKMFEGSIEYIDGSRKYDDRIRQKSMDQKIIDFSQKIDQMKNRKRNIQFNFIENFESFILYLKSFSKKITLIKAPYYNEYWNKLSAMEMNYKKVEEYIDSFALANVIEVKGYFHNDSTNQSHFYDEIHPTRELIISLFGSK